MTCKTKSECSSLASNSYCFQKFVYGIESRCLQLFYDSWLQLERILKSSVFDSRYPFFKKWASPGLFFVYFRSFQSNIITIFTTDQCEKMSCPSSIWRQDSNPQPSEREPPPITRAPALFPLSLTFALSFDTTKELLRSGWHGGSVSTSHVWGCKFNSNPLLLLFNRLIGRTATLMAKMFLYHL